MQNHIQNPWRLSVAPMLDWTDRHYRYLARLFTKHARLYTEMIHMDAIIYGNREAFLGYKEIEHPIALQLGGSDANQLAKAAKIIHDYQYDEINLNCGCPSLRVQKGMFGASLMQNVNLVADCLLALQDASHVDVTIKHRIGIDEEESYTFLRDFVGGIVQKTACKTFIVHARNAWLQGLSPKENREIPPLKYQYVYQLKKDFPDLNIIINGGFVHLTSIEEQFKYVDGVMVGRKAYHHPQFLKEWDNIFFADRHRVLQVDELIQKLYLYARTEIATNTQIQLRDIVRHYLGLFHGQPQAKTWRQILSNHVLLNENKAELILEAYEAMHKTGLNTSIRGV